jgi:hypothetical protein
MDFRKANLLHDTAGGLEIGLRFTGKSHDHIRGEGRFIQRFTDQLTTIDKQLGTPASFHASQDGIGTTLQANVQVWTDAFREFGHHGAEFPCHLGCFDAGETNAKITLHLHDRPYQVGQSRPVFLGVISVPVHAVMSQVNFGEHDFLVAVFL